MQLAIEAYYTALKQYEGLGVTRETSIRSAMQYLLDAAGCEAGWKLTPEHHLPNGKIPDGTFLDEFKIAHGYWEAKDTKDDLETEIRNKFAIGYPADNIIFEDTRRAVLFQGRNNRFEFDLTNRDELLALLMQFKNYEKPHFENFKRAVDEFATELPKLAGGTKAIIEREREQNTAFKAAFSQFHELCMNALNPQISAETIEEMLVQHLLTERLFRTIFENPDFTRRNVIAAEIEKVIDALTKRAFNRADFLKSLDRFYVPIETEGKSITEWNDKQEFLNKVYERFFQGFSTKQADTHGIVYTPQPIVNFMLASVEHLLQTEFGSSLSAPGVNVLDPCTGTGNFVVNLLRHHIARRDMQRKYEQELFANEIMLLPYYIASLNIEHAYYEMMGEYAPFEGLCFADTLTLAEGEQLGLFAEANTERTQRQKETPITVIIGNPPYNVGQVNENDNNKNRAYEIVDKKVSTTYAKASKASSKSKLSDAYVKFFRWATDRLKGEDGIVCYVSNNGFLQSLAFDGFRKCLADDFTTIYHLDMGGNARMNGGGNVFGVMVGVGITILVKRQKGQSASPNNKAHIFYYAQDMTARASEKLKLIEHLGSISGVTWQELKPDAKGNWLTEGMQEDFDTFLPMGTKEGKAAKDATNVIFKNYSLGANTNRDNWMYDFNAEALAKKAASMIEVYNAEISRWVRAGSPKDIDNFVLADETKIKWSSRLKECFARCLEATFDPSHIRKSLYRPFSSQYLYFDSIMTHRQGQLPHFFPTPETEAENMMICTVNEAQIPFSAQIAACIPGLHYGGRQTQCFPFYVYDEDGTNRRENITDWALQQFREAHGQDVTTVADFLLRLRAPAPSRLSHPLRRKLEAGIAEDTADS